MFTDLNLTDMECCHELFHREVLQQLALKENRFGFEHEITARIARMKGARIYEVSVSYSRRTYTEGKKINWKGRISAFRCAVKYNVFAQRFKLNYMSLPTIHAEEPRKLKKAA